MTVLSIGLWLAGVVLIAVGYARARAPWSRYRMLKAQDENVARYEAWRGRQRDDDRAGTSIAMEVLRRQAQNAGLIAIAGFVLVFLGFFVR